MSDEKRFLHRKKILEIEPYFIIINNIKHKVNDITSGGCSFYLNKNYSHKFEPSQEISNVEIIFNDVQIGHYSDCKVINVNIENQTVHIKFLNKNKTPIERDKRIDTITSFAPRGFFESELKQFEKIHFTIVNISAQGFLAKTSARNNQIFVSKKDIPMTLSFPMEEPFIIYAKIIYTDEDKADNSIYFGLATEDMISCKDILARYCNNFSLDYSFIEEFKNQKIFGKKIKHSLKFDIIREQKDIDGVEKLRKICYSSVGKLTDSSLVKIDEFNKQDKSRVIITVKNNNEFVGSVRLLNRIEGKPIELDSLLKLENKLLGKDVIELSRLCILPAYQKTDLLHGIFEIVTEYCLILNAKYVVSSCEDKLLKLYTPLGFKKNGQTYSFEGLNNTKHHVIYGETETIHNSKKLNPVMWYAAYGDSYKYFLKYNLMQSKNFSIYKKIQFYVLLLFLKIFKKRLFNKIFPKGIKDIFKKEL